MNDDSIPPDIRRAAERICRAYGITGICDPGYISNVIAREIGRGDGEGNYRPDNYGERAETELARNADGRLCCSACGSTELRYFEWTPATRPFLGSANGALFFDSNQYETWEPPGDAQCIDCAECLAQHQIPQGYTLEWFKEDYAWEAEGRDAFRHALGERYCTDMFDPGTDYVDDARIDMARDMAIESLRKRHVDRRSAKVLAHAAPDPRTLPLEECGEDTT